MTLSVLATFLAKEDKVNELKKSLRALLAPTRKEGGCLNYDLHQNQENSREFFLYENWIDKEHLDKHLNSPHLIEFKSKMDSLLEQSFNIKLADQIQG